MTIFDKIEVKLIQFSALSMTILLSRKWFAWPLKLPVFALLVCVWVITRPYEWLYIRATTRNATEANAIFKKVILFNEKTWTEKLEDFIMVFY